MFMDVSSCPGPLPRVRSSLRAGRGGGGRGAAVLAARFAPLLLPPFAPVPALPDLDVAVLLFESGGEDVGAVVAAEEIQGGDVRRPGRGLQAGEAGRADRSRRQTGITISLVGRIDAQIVVMDAAVPAAEPPQREDHRGIGVEPHVAQHAVAVDAGDDRPLGGGPRLLLHDAGESDYL